MPTNPESFQKINKFVVLMMENRSFDHLLGALQDVDARIVGLTKSEFNYQDPSLPVSERVYVRRATQYEMSFDPPHEFNEVQTQLYAPAPSPTATPTMGGFVVAAESVGGSFEESCRVMEYFPPEKMPVLTTLAQQFAVFNYWFSPLPGPTWPNRFFVHAATSGGLTVSPTTEEILRGYTFPRGTLFKRLDDARRSWRIYHDGLPQTVGIDDLRLEYIDPATKNFRDFEDFADDVAAGDLPDYTFIEPRYDIGGNYRHGNSMHPLNDIREGERFIKQVYETLRNSTTLWPQTMLIITFDEHGGFFDHVPPPPTVPTGDDDRYRSVDPTGKTDTTFRFDRLGVRVPGIVISAYTEAGTVIGGPALAASAVFDHSSVIATVSKRFGLLPLTARDEKANTLDIGVNRASPRISDADAPVSLPNPPADLAPIPLAVAPSTSPAGTFPKNEKSLLALALACHLQISPPSERPALQARFDQLIATDDIPGAAQFVASLENKVLANRETSQI